MYQRMPNDTVTFEQYLDERLMGERDGYYTRHVRFGSVETGGDFCTYPTLLSPYFGAAIAEHAYRMWQGMVRAGSLGAREAFTVIEHGAGEGHLARDFLERSQRYPWFHRLVRYDIYERSRRLRGMQTEAARPFKRQVRIHAVDIGHAPRRRIKGLILENDVLSATAVHKVLIRRNGDHQVTLVRKTPDGVEEAFENITRHPRVARYLQAIEPALSEAFAGSARDEGFLYVNPRAEAYYRWAADSLQAGYVLSIDNFTDTCVLAHRALAFGRDINNQRIPWPQFKAIRAGRVTAIPYEMPGPFDVAIAQDVSYLAQVAEQRGLRRLAYAHQGCLFAGVALAPYDCRLLAKHWIRDGHPPEWAEVTAGETLRRFLLDGGYSTPVGGFSLLLMQKAGTDDAYRFPEQAEPAVTNGQHL